jgi:hypothetical protein
VLDNLNTHKKCDRWLKKHPNVHLHYTPTRSSRLNQIETWFSILQGNSVARLSYGRIPCNSRSVTGQETSRAWFVDRCFHPRDGAPSKAGHNVRG